jgi:uncharacterized membrane protein YciS (DUF1049 family)
MSTGQISTQAPQFVQAQSDYTFSHHLLALFGFGAILACMVLLGAGL